MRVQKSLPVIVVGVLWLGFVVQSAPNPFFVLRRFSTMVGRDIWKAPADSGRLLGVCY